MFYWISENRTLLYMLLGIVALGLVVGWWQTKRGKFLLGMAVPVLLIVCVWLIGRTVETDAQQIERKLGEMSQGVHQQNLDRIFAHISASFTFAAHDKAAFRKRSDEVIRNRHVEEVRVWDVQVKELSREKRIAKVWFNVKPKGEFGGEALFYLVKAEFVLDPDGEWRMKTFQVFNPYVDINQPLQVPGF